MEELNLKKVVEEVSKLMEKEDRKDALFRHTIVGTQLGDAGKYLTHDPILNPKARQHGTPVEEELAYGQLLVQTIGLMWAREIDVFKALDIGLQNWQDRDWQKRIGSAKNKGDEIKGMGVCLGKVEGIAYILSEIHPIEEMPEGSILVAKFVKPDIARYLKKASAVVTDQGGRTSHVAIIAKEFGIPCIVGTGNATEFIVCGATLRVEITAEKAVVYDITET